VAISHHSKLIVGCGYLGFRAAQAWVTDGYEVSAVTRSDSHAAEFLAAGLSPLIMDLAAPNSHRPLSAVEAVLWAVGFDRSATASREQVWLDGLKRIVQNLTAAPRRFVYVSSTSVYGEADGESVDETTQTNPTSEGGQCCLQAEQLLRRECTERFPETQVVVLRMAGIYGPNRLLRRIDDLQNRTPLPGEPDHWLNLIHVDDAVRAVQYAAIAEAVPAVINVVNAGSVTREQYYTKLAQLASAPSPVFGTINATGRQRGGNKRVTSRHSDHKSLFHFDDVLQGLDDAFQRTESPG